MNDLYVYIAIFIVFIVVVIAIVIFFLPKEEGLLPYVRRMHLMTVKERELFSLLDECVPVQYYIFPQIHIASILEVKKGERKWQTYFNKIISKSIDFVIFDKVNISPVLAIELDDSTHLLEKRMLRDGFVNKAIKDGGIKMLRFKTEDLSNRENIKSKILNELISKDTA